ncbi:MAG: glycosyltransferase family 4 protein [Acidobacteriia bacterium]|nr:glycosyltransferase family 4 protein [Terriglobia bacterium]
MSRRVLVCAYACVADVGSPQPGGGDLMAWKIIKRLSRLHRLWVLTAAQNRPAIESALQKEPLPNVTFVYLGLPRFFEPLLRAQGLLQFYAYLWQWKAYFAARALHRRIRFDLFHHLTYENDWMASIIGALLPIPYLRGPCGGAHRIPSAFLPEFSFRERLAEWRREYGQWLFRHDPFFILSHSRAKAILVCNHEAWHAIPRRWKHKAQLMTVNGVAREFLFESPEAEDRSKRFSVLSAGRLIRLKAFDLAIRGFNLFSAKVPDAEFTIVGDGPDFLRLQGLIGRLGLQGQVRFEKWMPREELLAKMRLCDVFLFTSLRDGGGLVVVEAMASAKPVVCLDLGGPGMHVTDECGIKVPPHSPDQVVRDVAEALERLYDDRELRAKMGQAARTRAEQVYTWDHLGDRLLKIYEEVLGIPSHEA